MTVARMRPTFLLETDLSSDEVVKCIRQSIANTTGQYRGRFAGTHAMISIDDSRRHFWSPWLHLEVRETDSVREVFGRFSPHPSIWTGFMLAYLAIATIMFFALMLAFSQLILKSAPWAFLALPIGLLVAGTLWFASQAGQKLAHDEMGDLRSMVEACLAKKQ